MSRSHRKFGDLLEEGIKRVYLTRKKPIGYILDEFGYELRPDDSSKGRHALGHWYYKKRIPASMADVAKLAELIAANSDVDIDWLGAFLKSAGYSEAEKLCEKLFPSKVGIASKSAFSDFEQTDEREISSRNVEKELPSVRNKYFLKWLLFGIPILIGITAFLFLRQQQNPTTLYRISTATHSLQQPIPTLPTRPIITKNTPSLTPLPDFASFDGKCPAASSVPAFQYSSPRSFRDFLNNGGSFVALQDGFAVLIQKQQSIYDGRISNSDLTGDGVPEIIVSAILEKGSIWQILGCNSGRYDALADVTDTDNLYLRFTVDLNGNKLPEIVSYRQTQSDSSQQFEFFIQEWNGHQVVVLIDNIRFDSVGKHLPTDITDWKKSIANATVTTRDINGDGLYEMVVTGGLISPVPTCETRFERQFTEVWAWNGKTFQLVERLYDLPSYRFQRSADGDLAFALKQFDIALDAYQDVVFSADLLNRDEYPLDLEYCKEIGPATDAALFSNEQEQLAAYARWRILLLNSFTGSADSMKVVYQALKEKFPQGQPGYSYAAIATAFWEEYQASRNLQAACDAANLIASNQPLYPSHKAANICFVP